MYTGPKNSFTAGGLKPVSTHSFCLRALTEGDESPYSKVVSASTPESGTLLFMNVFLCVINDEIAVLPYEKQLNSHVKSATVFISLQMYNKKGFCK